MSLTIAGMEGKGFQDILEAETFHAQIDPR